MTQEDKELLMKDLCARLPYGVKVKTWYDKPLVADVYGINRYTFVVSISDVDEDAKVYLDNVKPYLRPMSSMTEEEKKEYWAFFTTDGHGFPTDDVDKHKIDEYLDWLNAHHFDFRGLIPKGLAIEVTKENNPYKK